MSWDRFPPMRPGALYLLRGELSGKRLATALHPNLFSSGTHFSALLRYYPQGQHYRSLEEKITQPSSNDDWLFDDSKTVF